MANGSAIRIGIISDTHSLLRPEIASVFHNVDRILHAGDVGDVEILRKLSSIAPITAVRGNTDFAPGCVDLPLCETLSIGTAEIYMHHGHLDELDIVPAGTDIVVTGHTHAPLIRWRDDVLFINPGSAGPRRFHLPVSVALLTIMSRARSAQIVELRV